jgi:hypothetical protein
VTGGDQARAEALRCDEPPKRRIRWFGDPHAPEQPDAGDVLTYNKDPHPEWYEIVHFAAQVRGRKRHHLWLVVSRYDLTPGCGIPEEVWQRHLGGGRFIPAEKSKSRRRR